MSGPQADILPGNALPIRNIPLGTLVHNVELQPGRGAQICRSAGTQAQLLAKEGERATLKLPSGEVRLVASSAWPPSARSATSTTRTCRSARRGACAGRDSGRPCAAP